MVGTGGNQIHAVQQGPQPVILHAVNHRQAGDTAVAVKAYAGNAGKQGCRIAGSGPCRDDGLGTRGQRRLRHPHDGGALADAQQECHRGLPVLRHGNVIAHSGFKAGVTRRNFIAPGRDRLENISSLLIGELRLRQPRIEILDGNCTSRDDGAGGVFHDPRDTSRRRPFRGGSVQGEKRN